MPKKKKEEETELTTSQLDSLKRESFCELYTSKGEFFGNGVQSYIEAYSPDTSKTNWYKTACVRASQLLSNLKVFTRINELLEEQGLNDQNADKQLLFLMNQHAEFGNKLGAVKEYNKIKARYKEDNEQKAAIIKVINYKDEEDEETTN